MRGCGCILLEDAHRVQNTGPPARAAMYCPQPPALIIDHYGPELDPQVLDVLVGDRGVAGDAESTEWPPGKTREDCWENLRRVPDPRFETPVFQAPRKLM